MQRKKIHEKKLEYTLINELISAVTNMATHLLKRRKKFKVINYLISPLIKIVIVAKDRPMNSLNIVFRCQG